MQNSVNFVIGRVRGEAVCMLCSELKDLVISEHASTDVHIVRKGNNFDFLGGFT